MNLYDVIFAQKMSGGSAGSLSVFVITDETVPESVNWQGTIPDTFAGNTGEIGELALYYDYFSFWYLADNEDGYYDWMRVLSTDDLNRLMSLAPLLTPTQEEIAALPAGQVFTTAETIGVKTAAAGTAGDKQAPTKEYVDNLASIVITDAEFEVSLDETTIRVTVNVAPSVLQGYLAQKGTVIVKGTLGSTEGGNLRTFGLIVTQSKYAGSDYYYYFSGVLTYKLSATNSGSKFYIMNGGAIPSAQSVSFSGLGFNPGDYYTRSQISSFYYTKSQVDNLISAISTLSFEVAQTKPVTNIKTNVIYLIPKSTAETNNVYDEWIYVNNAWELIGSTQIDLSQYAQKSELPTKTSDLTNDSGFLTQHQDISGKADKATTLAGYGITNAYTKTETDQKVEAASPFIVNLYSDGNGGFVSFEINGVQLLGTCFDVQSNLPRCIRAYKIYGFESQRFVEIYIDMILPLGANTYKWIGHTTDENGTVTMYSYQLTANNRRIHFIPEGDPDAD